MSNPTEKVLEMLVAEKIDVEQSRRLLDRLNEGPNEVEPLSQSKAAIIDLLETEKIDFRRKSAAAEPIERTTGKKPDLLPSRNRKLLTC